jgi:putative SOS response-associated peptidase YedK
MNKLIAAARTMFGRYVRRGDKQKISEYFHVNPQSAELPRSGEDYNGAPTTFQPIIRQSRESGDREMVLARWGLVPFFTKSLDEVKGLSTINARAESITKARPGESR